MAGTPDASDTRDRELVVRRTFAAPPALVFQMFLDPAHLARWFGPEGFSITTKSMDTRPGGAWRFVMHGPDGRDYPNRIVYREIVPHERIAYDHDGDGVGDGPAFRVTVQLAAAATGTSLVVRAVFPSAEALAFVVREYKADEGARQTYGRLGALAESVARGDAGPAADRSGVEFVLAREFAAPRELVFAAWTDAKHLAQWMGPKGARGLSAKMDLRAGGSYHYALEMPGGLVLWGIWKIREVVVPERLVVVQSFSDEHGGVTRHPMAPTWPLRMLSRTEFTEHAGRTTVVLRVRPLDATPEEIATFLGGHVSMRGGWGGTFDRLDDHVGAQSRGSGLSRNCPS